MLLGRTLNVTQEYDSKAYEYLSKAVKLDPKLVEAWNHLGELYWKKGDVNNAKNCFSGALTHVIMAIYNFNCVLLIISFSFSFLSNLLKTW